MRKICWGEPFIGDEEKEAVQSVMDSGWIGGNGPITKKFEEEFARKVDAKYAIAVNNGTSSLLLALLASKYIVNYMVTKVPTFTFIATVNTAKLLSREIIFMDAKKDTFNIDWNTDKFCNIAMPVDVGGLPCDYDSISNPNLFIIEDAAEALGAEYRGRKIGSIANITSFSLHSTKIISTGEGGMVTTNSPMLYSIMRAITNQGYYPKKSQSEYSHSIIGFNFRMTEIQSAIGLVQLKRLNGFIRKRREFANIYRDILGETVKYQAVPKNRKHSYFLFSILTEPKIRDKLIWHLERNKIESKVTFRPVHKQPAYLDYTYVDLPNSEYIYERILSLPIHNCLTEEDIKYIAEKVLEITK